MATKPPLQGCIQMPYRFKNLTTPGKGPSILSATIFEEGNVCNQNSLGICVGNQNAFKKHTKNPGGQSRFPKHVETNLFVLHIPGPRNFKALKRCSILKQMGLSCLDSLLSGKTVGPKRGGGNNLIQSTHVVWRTKNSCGSHYTASQNLPGKPLYSAQIQSPWHPTGLFSGANCNPKFKPTFKTIY